MKRRWWGDHLGEWVVRGLVAVFVVGALLQLLDAIGITMQRAPVVVVVLGYALVGGLVVAGWHWLVERDRRTGRTS
jgi:ABC-type nickel/cobalt efflux system permease component RcnA